MYCIAIPIKLTEWVEWQICINFCIKLEHSSMETIQMIQKATAMGNWWWAASSQQCTCSCITSRAEVFGETSNHPGNSAPLEPRFGTLWLLAFPKTKITFEREEISDPQGESGKYDSTAKGNSNKGFCRVFWTTEEILGELCKVSGCLLWRGLSCHCPTYNVSYIFFKKCLFFILYGWIPSGHTSYT